MVNLVSFGQGFPSRKNSAVAPLIKSSGNTICIGNRKLTYPQDSRIIEEITINLTPLICNNKPSRIFFEQIYLHKLV